MASVATVATDGGENRLNLDPIQLQVLRVADSLGEVYFEDFIAQSLSPDEILRFFFRSNPRLPRLMDYLRIDWDELFSRSDFQRSHLLSMLRELMEWAALLKLASRPPARLLIRDGLLRGVLVPARVFDALRQRFETLTGRHGHLLVGVAKRSRVVNYLSAGLALAETFGDGRAAFVDIPEELEREAAPAQYRWVNGRVMGLLHVARLDRGEAVPLMPVDLSFLAGEDGLAVTGMLLWRVFQHNVRHLTDVAQRTVRCVAILEEAQTMLGDRRLDDRDVFVRWVKEGRKYGLGCVLITQQPSSISGQIISQGDNFFVFHLLNEGDLQTLRKYNGYFTEEILGFIRGEPIAGNCYFWSAPSQPFVLSARVCDFESACQPSSTTEAAAAGPREPFDPGRLVVLTARAVRSALAGNPRLWLYPVGKLLGKDGDGWVAFSRDYLHDLVAATLTEEAGLRHTPEGTQWLREKRPVEIETVLKRHQVRGGYAVLAGVARQVWVLPRGEFTLQRGKTLRPQVVDITAGL